VLPGGRIRSVTDDELDEFGDHVSGEPADDSLLIVGFGDHELSLDGALGDEFAFGARHARTKTVSMG